MEKSVIVQVSNDSLQFDETIIISDQESEPLIASDCKVEHSPQPLLPQEIIIMSNKTITRHGILGTAMTFSPLSDKVLLQLKDSNSHFTQEDFDVLREMLNATVFMRMFSLVGITGFTFFIRMLLSVFIVLITTLLNNDILKWQLPLWYIMLMFCFSIVTMAGPFHHILRFNAQSFRQTHTIVVFKMQHCFYGVPCLKIIPYNVQPCQEYVSEMFKTLLYKKYPNVILNLDVWDREVNCFVSLCLLKGYAVDSMRLQSYFMAESVLKRHVVCYGHKCLCEIIEASVNLSYPPKVKVRDLRLNYASKGFLWICGSCMYMLPVISDSIVFKYVINEPIDYK